MAILKRNKPGQKQDVKAAWEEYQETHKKIIDTLIKIIKDPNNLIFFKHSPYGKSDEEEINTKINETLENNHDYPKHRIELWEYTVYNGKYPTQGKNILTVARLDTRYAKEPSEKALFFVKFGVDIGYEAQRIFLDDKEVKKLYQLIEEEYYKREHDFPRYKLLDAKRTLKVLEQILNKNKDK